MSADSVTPYLIPGMAAVDAGLLLAYALLWPRRKDVSAYIYVHKGALWYIWLSSWILLLARLGEGPLIDSLRRAAGSPQNLAIALLSLLGVLIAIYLTYLFVVYPFFASLRPSLSRESLGIDWQLDVFVEDKVMSLVEEAPFTPLLLLDMGLAGALRDLPADDRLALLQNLWRHYVPVITNRAAAGAAVRPGIDPDPEEDDVRETMQLALETAKIAENHLDSGRRFNVLALPLMADGRVVLVMAAIWPRKKPFRNIFSLVAKGFCTMREQFIIAAEVPQERMALYGDPWLDDYEGGN